MKKEAKHWEAFIPGVNEYPYEKAQKWAQGSLARSKAQQDNEVKVKHTQEKLPRKTANYAIEMTFGKWRLMGPRGDETKSPMEQVLEYLKPVIDSSRWKEFKKQFKKKLLQQFEIIGWFNYAADRIDKVNGRINQLIGEFLSSDVSVSLNFVPHPTTAESFYTKRLVELRSKIMEHFTSQPLEAKSSQQMAGSQTPIQMDMHLDLEVIRKK